MPIEPVYNRPDLNPERPHQSLLFPDYMPSHRSSKDVIQHTLYVGWLSFILALLLLWAHPEAWPPVYWSLAGLSLGIVLILRGLLKLSEPPHATPLAQKATITRDAWFPLTLFVAQTAFMFIIASILWVTMPKLGAAPHLLVTIGLYVMLALISIRRLMAEWVRRKFPGMRSPAQDVLQYSTTFVVTILVALAITHAISPFGHPITGDNSLQIVVIWVIATFVMLACLILIIDRLFSRRNR